MVTMDGDLRTYSLDVLVEWGQCGLRAAARVAGNEKASVLPARQRNLGGSG